MELKIKSDNYSLSFSNNITGILSTEKDELLRILNLTNEEVYIDGKRVIKSQINTIKKQISIVNIRTITQPYLDTVQENMEYIISENRLVIKDPLKKMQDSLRIVGLNTSYLNKNINILSSSELKQIGIAIALLSNPNIIILDEPFMELDKKNEKRISSLLTKLKEDFNKTIIIISNNINTLYKYSDRLVLIKKDKVIYDDLTDEIPNNVSYIMKNGFEVPDIVLFTYKVRNNKKINISYHHDIRDIIKDIYKHI